MENRDTEKIESYVTRHRQVRRRHGTVGLLSVFTAVVVFLSLMLPAFSQDGGNPSLSAETASAKPGETITVTVGATAEEGERVFLLTAKEGNAALAEKYTFDSDSNCADVTDTAGNTVTLHRIYTDSGAAEYWFALPAGQTSELKLDFVSATAASAALRGVSAPALADAQTMLADDAVGSTLALTWADETATAAATSEDTADASADTAATSEDAADAAADTTATGEDKTMTTTEETTDDADTALTAQSDDGGISGYTIYYDAVGDTGYYVMEKDGSRKTVYCYNHELAQPKSTGTDGYTRYNYFSDAAPEIAYTEDGSNTPHPKTKQQVAGLLYAGYPVDGAGYISEYSEPTGGGRDATYETQSAVWVFARDAATTVSDYYTAIFAYGANTTGDPYGHTGDVSITGDGTISQVNGVYRSGIYTVSGSFDGSFWFDSLPDNVTVHNASTGDAMTSLKSGDSFYFEITGTPSATISLNYTYIDSTVYYYAGSAVVSGEDATTAHPAGSKYQNFIRMEATTNKASLTLNYTSPPGDTTGPKTTVTVTKTWSDGNTVHSGESVTVHLYADGESAGAAATLSAANNWTYTFSGLPYYRSDGSTPVEYSIAEDAVAGYTTTTSVTSTTGPTVTVSGSTVTSFTDGQYYSISANGYAMAVKESNGIYSLVSKAYDSSDTSQLWKAVAGSGPEGIQEGSWFYLENLRYPGEYLYFYFKDNNTTTGEAMTLSNTPKTTFAIDSAGKLYTLHYLEGSGWYYKGITISSKEVSFDFDMYSIPGTTLTYRTASISDGSTAITVTNTASSYALPSTGGVGTLPFVFAGLALTFVPAAIITSGHRRKKRGGGSYRS